jgi:hypothetical protein
VKEIRNRMKRRVMLGKVKGYKGKEGKKSGEEKWGGKGGRNKDGGRKEEEKGKKS